MSGRRDERIASQFSGRLLKGETILWSGRPSQGIRLTARDVLLIPTSLVWCGLAVFFLLGAVLKSSAPQIFVLVGSLFVMIGLFMVFGRFFLDAWVRSKLAYAVTDKRILISRWGPWPNFKALQRDRLPEAAISKGSKGSGTIRFGRPATMFTGFRGGGLNVWLPSLDPTPQLIGIDDVVRVYSVIQERIQGG